MCVHMCDLSPLSTLWKTFDLCQLDRWKMGSKDTFSPFFVFPVVIETELFPGPSPFGSRSSPSGESQVLTEWTSRAEGHEEEVQELHDLEEECRSFMTSADGFYLYEMPCSPFWGGLSTSGGSSFAR